VSKVDAGERQPARIGLPWLQVWQVLRREAQEGSTGVDTDEVSGVEPSGRHAAQAPDPATDVQTN
jgi:hypothetical protein